VANIKKINFIGSGVTASINGGDPTQLDVVIPGGGGANLEVDEDGSTVVASCSVLNFTGDGVVVSDAGGGQSDVDIPGGVLVQENSTPIGRAQTLNFNSNLSIVDEGGGVLQVNAAGGGGLSPVLAMAGMHILPGGNSDQSYIPGAGFKQSGLLTASDVFRVPPGVTTMLFTVEAYTNTLNVAMTVEVFVNGSSVDSTSFLAATPGVVTLGPESVSSGDKVFLHIVATGAGSGGSFIGGTVQIS